MKKRGCFVVLLLLFALVIIHPVLIQSTNDNIIFRGLNVFSAAGCTFSFSPAAPIAGKTVTCYVTGSTPWAYVNLDAYGPNTVHGQWGGVVQNGSSWTWTYTLPSLSQGTYTVKFTADNYATQIGQTTLAVSGTSGCTFSFNPAAPTAGQSVTCYVTGSTPWAYVNLDASGPNTVHGQWGGVVQNGNSWTWTYTLPSLSQGSYTVKFTADNYAKNIGQTTLNVGGGSSLTDKLHGTIYNKNNGSRYANMYVSVWGKNDGVFRTAYTNGSGIYEFTGLNKAQQYNICVNCKYVDGVYQKINSSLPSDVRNNVTLISGPDGWHGEDFPLGGSVATPTPTRPVTTPTPTPPVNGLTRSKLTIHTAFAKGDGESRQFILAARPRIVKLLDSVDRAAQIKSDSPGTLVIGRLYMDPQPAIKEGDEMDAATQAQNWWNQFKGTILANPSVDYWEGLNEPVVDTEGKMVWYNAFETARTLLLAQNSRKACIGNFSVGTPDVNKPAIIQKFYLAIDTAISKGGILGVHEYDAPTMNSSGGWCTLRYRKLYDQYLKPTNRNIQLAITECGIDGGVIQQPGGWKNFTTAQDYFEQLKWYDSELQKDSYVLGATIFSLEIYGWDTFDIGGTVRSLLQNYCAQLR